MKREIDWRHLVAAVMVVGLILYGGFRLIAAKPLQPNAKAPAGPNARMEDAPEFPTANTGASGAVPASLPK